MLLVCTVTWFCIKRAGLLWTEPYTPSALRAMSRCVTWFSDKGSVCTDGHTLAPLSVCQSINSSCMFWHCYCISMFRLPGYFCDNCGIAVHPDKVENGSCVSLNCILYYREIFVSIIFCEPPTNFLQKKKFNFAAELRSVITSPTYFV